MKISPKHRVLCLELKEGRGQLKKGRGKAGKGQRGDPPFFIRLAGALNTQRLVPGWVTAMLSFVEDPANTTFDGRAGMRDNTISGFRQQG